MAQSNLYTDDYMKASENLKMVLQFLSKYQTPASPINYQVTYEIVSGQNIPLKEALDEQLKKQDDKLSEQFLLKLHKQFLSPDDEALEEKRQQLQEIISSIRSGVDDSNGELSSYIDSLNNFSGILSDSDNLVKLETEAQKMMKDTLSVEQSQRKFEVQMTSMEDEMESLRNQLEQVREESLTDALTGLANRKAFDQMLEELIEENKDNNSSFSVIIADIDHFKKFNDTYGHLVGDKVLKYVSNTIKSCVKGRDMTARFGGEEFTLLLPDTDISGAEIVAEQVREVVAKKNLVDKTVSEDYGKITISLGACQFKTNEQPKEVLNRADKALYQAKKNGRNRVEKAG